jgi:phosphoglycerate kinase
MNNLRNIDVGGKRVLVRVDFNAPLTKEGEVSDNFRIKKAIPTLEYLRNKGAKVIIITHLGQPEGKDLKYSIRPIARRLWELMSGRVKFINDTIGKAVEKEISQMKDGDIVVLENLRFYKGEEENSEEFSRQLARLGDVFVQDGFGVCHRSHSSMIGVTKFLPSYPGLLLEEEIRILSNALVSPDRPLVSIIGGAKVSTKTRVIERLLDKSDYLLLGGKIAISLLVAKGQCI